MEEPMTFDGRKPPEMLPDSYGEYGEGLEPSPTKAIIGLAVMIVIGVVLYQVSGSFSAIPPLPYQQKPLEIGTQAVAGDCHGINGGTDSWPTIRTIPIAPIS